MHRWDLEFKGKDKKEKKERKKERAKLKSKGYSLSVEDKNLPTERKKIERTTTGKLRAAGESIFVLEYLV